MSRILGIDLGTSTSEMAIMENGKPIVLLNPSGEKITPSIVGISEQGEFIVGQNAKEQIILRPEDTVMEVKRIMGSSEKVKMGKKEFTPQEVSAYILKYLKQGAEEVLGEKIDRAVITVPAYFTDEQRRATVEAGKLAGFKVERILNEPTAAALAYGIEHMEENKHVLVYDLGGGTLDVTVLEMFEGVLEVKASSGNNHLGGKDFDQRIIDVIINEFHKKHSIDLSKDARAMARIKEGAEACKIALSKEAQYTILLPFIAEKEGNPIGLEKTITAGEFETLVEDLVEQSHLPMKIALKDSNLEPEDIQVVLLVGGSTRIPMVKKFVEKIMKQEAKTLVDPDLAVVIGAAIQSGILNQELSADQDILITDVSPYTLGIETLDYIGDFPITDVYDVIIPRNTTIPVTKEKIYFTASNNQEKVEIKIYQGDNRKASSNNSLGNFMLTGIPAAPAAQEKIKVRFAYDINGILQVEAIILSTGGQMGITVETTGVEAEKDLSKWTESSHGRKYKRLIKKAEELLEEVMGTEDYDELDEKIRTLKEALIAEEETIKLGELEEELSDLMYDLEEDK